MQKNEMKKQSQMTSLIKNLILGGCISLIICIFLALMFSFGVVNGVIGEHKMMQLTCGACLIATFLGAVIVVKRVKTKALISGISIGLIFCIMQLIFGSVVGSDMAINSTSVPVLCSPLVGGMAAGLTGAGKKKKRRK